MMTLNPDLYRKVCEDYGELILSQYPPGDFASATNFNTPASPGSIARVGPNDLITCSPELLLRMSAARSPYTRAPWYYIATKFEQGKDLVFSMLNEDQHNKRRLQMGGNKVVIAEAWFLEDDYIGSGECQFEYGVDN